MTTPEYNRLRLYYFLLLVSYLFMFVPLAPAMGLSLVMMVGVVFAAYRLRGQTDREGLSGQHATYIIRTFWLSSFFFLAGVFLATSIIWSNGDMSALNDMAMRVGEGQAMTEQDIAQSYALYYQTNKAVIWTASAVGVGPFIAYVLWRMGKGYHLLYKRRGFADAKSWF